MNNLISGLVSGLIVTLLVVVFRTFWKESSFLGSRNAFIRMRKLKANGFLYIQQLKSIDKKQFH